MSVTNLNKARKARARAEEKALADENVVKHGRSKAEKTQAATQEAKSKSNVDAHKRER